MIHAIEATICKVIRSSLYHMGENMRLEEQNCNTCVRTKGTKQPVAGRFVKELQILTVHTNFCGLSAQGTFGQKQLVGIFPDKPHRYTNHKLMRSRDKVPGHCYNSTSYLELSTNLNVSGRHSDNASEFVRMRRNMHGKTIEPTPPTPCSSHSNGLTVTMNPTLMHKVRAVLKNARM